MGMVEPYNNVKHRLIVNMRAYQITRTNKHDKQKKIRFKIVRKNQVFKTRFFQKTWKQILETRFLNNRFNQDYIDLVTKKNRTFLYVLSRT